jgi:hypothetical protein
MGDLSEVDPPWTEAPSVVPTTQTTSILPLMATPAATLDWIVVAAAHDFDLIDLDQAGQRAATRGEHAAARLTKIS